MRYIVFCEWSEISHVPGIERLDERIEFVLVNIDNESLLDIFVSMGIEFEKDVQHEPCLVS